MNFDAMHYPYPSRRNTVYAKNGMVAASQPLAAQAGLDILKKGGNAIDAAIATAACLTVVEPNANGIGGDAFALVWTKGELHGLNSSGPAPKSISIEAVQAAGHKEIPLYGWHPVTVPGTPAAWAALSERFGRLPLTEVLQPAIDYAENGYPVSPGIGTLWNKEYKTFKKVLVGEQFENWFKTFAPEGRPPKIGELWRSPDHAKSLRSIAETKAESFYRGELADKIDEFSRKHNGFLRKEDLAGFYPDWVDPIHVQYRGYDVWEIPPNGQGLATLMALNVLKGFDFAAKDTADTYHKQIEALKLALTDGLHYITQHDKMTVSVEQLLSDAYALTRRQLIKDEAIEPAHGDPTKGGTIYLAAADGEGNMVSYIQSNYRGFGSGLVVPGTGISLHNRGRSFSLDPNHHNRLEPGKKPFHTIIPGFLTKDNEPVGPFGVKGMFMQTQGHLQVVMNMIDFHLNPQAALDAPRWQWISGKKVLLERSFPEHLALDLAKKGHAVEWSMVTESFGYGQIIVKDQHGVLAGGTEQRTDGCIASW
ncbi:gamma-glutamyltranspeptidase / glutathione hydrolase [Paenibacillus sp. GP183]|nr:gamma-glutamyltranspeptidase / glutathione hydrolase [Paenibacillus sp. GP183]